MKKEDLSDVNQRFRKIEGRLWQLENPPRFSVGDEAIFEDDTKSTRVTIIKIEYDPDGYWKYHLWLPEFKCTATFCDDVDWEQEGIKLNPIITNENNIRETEKSIIR